MLASVLDDLVDLLVGQADDGAHAAGDAALLHDPPSLANEPQRIGVVDGICGNRGGVLAGRVPGHRERHDLDSCLERLGSDRVQEREAGGQDRGLRVDGLVELLGRSLEDHA